MKQEESLQRFTDFNKLNVEEASNMLIQHLEQFPNDRDDLIDMVLEELNKELNKNYVKSVFSNDEVPRINRNKVEKIMKIFKLVFGKPKHNHIKRQIYTSNHLRISEAIQNCVIHHNRVPLINDLAVETGLSRTTIYKHLKDINLRLYTENENALNKVLIEKALAKLYKIGIEENNITALTSFIKFNQEQQPNNQTNYIQINNLRITQEQIIALPDDKAKDLIEILLAKTESIGKQT
jgi:hypothetical protein